MPNIKHTPAPWTLSEDQRIVGANGLPVAKLQLNPRNLNAEFTRIAADRRLMAAAPDMLAALKATVGENLGRAAAGMIRAAIAKAEGGE